MDVNRKLIGRNSRTRTAALNKLLQLGNDFI